MFVVPAHGREALTLVCLTQLRRTCDALEASGNFEASAVVVADDHNLTTARDLGFATVRRDNRFLGRKFNDGLQLACDAHFNPRPADFAVPCGSDDWIDPAIFDVLPGGDTVVGFTRAAFVDETGRHISSKKIDYEAGVGIRIFPRAMLHRVGYRPADEDKKRGCDTSILTNLKKSYSNTSKELRVIYNDHHPFQIVDWKSADVQLNSYTDVYNRFQGSAPVSPFGALEGIFPAYSLAEMHEHYHGGRP